MNKPLSKKLLFVLLFVPAIVLLYFGIFVWDAGVISNAPSSAEETTSLSTTAAETSHTSTTDALYDSISEEAAESTSAKAAQSTTASAEKPAESPEESATEAPAKTTAAPAAPTTAATTAKPPKSSTCTLTIDSTAAGKGYMLRSCAVTVNSGDTAYDVLCRACSDNSISINAKGTGYGIYVAGIGGLDEKEVGSDSGWMYYINGTAPQKACSKYKVSPGDTVLFYYTVDYSTP